MKSLNTEIYHNDGWVGCRTVISLDNYKLDQNEVYFEVPDEFENSLAKDSLAALVAGMMLAMAIDDTIVWNDQLSLCTIRGIEEFQSAYECYFPELFSGTKNIFKNTETNKRNSIYKGRKGVFFSSGVDSLHAAYFIKTSSGHLMENDDAYLIPIIGMDLHKKTIVNTVLQNTDAIAKSLGFGIMPMRTNVKDFILQTKRFDWARHVHGIAKAACALAVRSGFDSIMIGSAGVYGHISGTEGSLPRTDELWKTNDFELLHVGAAYSRLDKIRQMSQWDDWLGNMRVCFDENSEMNCGVCRKCRRTAFCLDALDMSDRAKNAFMDGAFESLENSFESLWTKDPSFIELVKEIAVEYERKGDNKKAKKALSMYQNLKPNSFKQCLRDFRSKLTGKKY